MSESTIDDLGPGYPLIANDEMYEGYTDGFNDHRSELPPGTNRSASYVHGWRNGRDDRTKEPRAPASQLRLTAHAILTADARKGGV